MEYLLHVLDGKELYEYCVYVIDLDNCDHSKCQRFEQAIHAVAFNFSKFDITKPRVFCGAPGHTFDNCSEVKDPNLKECYICAQLASNCFKKAIDDIGIKDVHTISSVSLLNIE